MAVNITLTSSMRSNLSSLKSLASQMSTTQVRLSTGKKVNSAIDNANSYYQSRALTNRASDLDMLLDAMGQSIQTVTSATQGIESGLKVIEQMSSIAQEAATVLSDDIIKITADMTTSQIQLALNKGGIFSLQDDIALTSSLSVGDDVTIVGNGHAITYEGLYGFRVVGSENVAGDAALKVIGNAKISGLTINYTNVAAQGVAIAIDSGSAEIDNLTINGETSANRLYGIQVLNGGKLTLDSTKNINLSGDYSEKLVNGNPDLWAGEYNTDMIIDYMGENGIAAYACKQFCAYGVAEDDENFGQGQWYLPGLGELCDMYGTDYNAISTNGGPVDASGAIGNEKNKVSSTLVRLASLGIANKLNQEYLYSSSQLSGMDAWRFRIADGARCNNTKKNTADVRPFTIIKNINDKEVSPEIGDVVYSDLTYGKVDDYDSSKIVVGVIAGISDDSSFIKVMGLSNLGGKQWISSDSSYDTIPGIKGYVWNGPIYTALAKGRGETKVTNTQVDPIDVSAQDYSEKFNTTLSAYDDLVNDSSYQGVNLLEGNSLRVMFNETRTHSYTVQGQKADSGSLGVDASHWETLSDVQTSIAQLNVAVATLRNIAETLGNHLSIIETRMNFTDAMCDVLQTGADDLVLADMNEESANYLALQTRNSLAVNALALAAQSNNAMLKLF